MVLTRLALIGLAATICCPATAFGAQITVTTTGDVVADDGACSLREAVTSAGMNVPVGGCPTGETSQDAIVLPAGRIQLAIAGAGEDLNASGDLDLLGAVSIGGAGAGTTAIDGGGLDRVLHVRPGANVTVRDLTITGGHAPDGAAGSSITGANGGPGADGASVVAGDGLDGEAGGAVMNRGTLTLASCVVSDNRSGDGGRGGSATGGNGGPAVAGGPGRAGGGAAGGDGGFAGSGGAIRSSGPLTISDCSFVGNRTGDGGDGGAGTGGRGSAGASASSSQPGGNGGAGTGGQADDGGNGGAVDGQAVITRSSFSQNRAGKGGHGGDGTGGAAGDGGNGVTGANGGNGAVGGAGSSGQGGEGGLGGGLAVAPGTLENVTLSGNAAGSGANGGAATGGRGGTGGRGSEPTGTGGAGGTGGAAIADDGEDAGIGGGAVLGSATVSHSTIAGNSAGVAGAGGTTVRGAGGDGGESASGGGANGAAGGLGAATGATAGNDPGNSGGLDGDAVTLRGSIVERNSPGNCKGSGSGLTDGGGNFTFPAATCIGMTADAELDPLADNGGPATMRPRPGSPARDAVPVAGGTCPATDQRGVPRPQGAACDSGAYEAGPPLATTGPASAIDATTATLNATIDARARVASVRFDYGTTTDYGNSSAPRDANGAVAEPVAGLAPGTTYHYRVVATAVDGTTVGADQTFTTSPLPAPLGPGIDPAPLVERLTITRSFRAASRGTSIAATRTGATVTYALSEAGTTRFRVEKPSPGRRVGRRCVKPTKRNRARRRCTRYVVLRGSFTHAGKAGTNRFKFTGRLRGRKLRPGSYRLVAVATDRAGNKSLPKRASFRIVR